MFPRSLKLNKIFNKNVIKVNYSCTKNITKRFILDWPRKSLKEEAITTKSNYLICKLYSNSSALSSYAWQKKQSKMEHQVWHKKFHDLHRKLLIVTYPTPSDPWHKKPKTFFKMCDENKLLLREKCPNMELFLVRIFLYSDWRRRFTS